MDPNSPPGPRIDVTRDGPYRVSGGLPLREQWIVPDTRGDSVDYREGTAFDASPEYELCRCGQSGSWPFCDDTHLAVGFDGTETASRVPYLDRAKTFEGPTMSLTDVEELCASARFCDPEPGTWDLVAKTDDPEARRLVAREVGHCPSGRLRARERATGAAVEPAFEPSIGLIEDTARTRHGPMDTRRRPGRVGRWRALRGAQPDGAVPLRPIGQQALLRRVTPRRLTAGTTGRGPGSPRGRSVSGHPAR